MKQTDSNPEPGQWTIRSWCAALELSEPWYYTLPPEFRPQTVSIGRLKRITEPPREWIKRVAQLGGVPPRKQRVAA